MFMFADEIWRSSAEIVEADLKKAEAAWKARRKSRPVPGRETLLASLKQNPESLRDRDIEEMSTQAVDKLEETQPKSNLKRRREAYEDWAELPAGAFVIALQVGRVINMKTLSIAVLSLAALTYQANANSADSLATFDPMASFLEARKQALAIQAERQRLQRKARQGLKRNDKQVPRRVGKESKTEALTDQWIERQRRELGIGTESVNKSSARDESGRGKGLDISAAKAVDTSSDGPAELNELMVTRSLKCTFGPGVSAEWDSGELQVERVKWGTTTPFHFDSIDAAEGSARMIGNAGSEDVRVLPTPNGLTFVEITAVGNLNFTTVFASVRAGTHEFHAVTSRHVSIFGPLPSQYYGSCKAW